MGAFKISKDKTRKTRNIIQEDLFYTEAQLSIDRTIRSYRPSSWGVAIGLFAFSVLLGVSGYWVVSGSGSEQRKPFVFFELKAIDGSGHPVAGASVRLDGTRLGVTDTFGEWRRFMRAALGSQVRFDVSKMSGGRIIESTRVFVVPETEAQEGEIELSGSVQLLTSEKNAANRVRRQERINKQRAAKDIVDQKRKLRKEKSESLGAFIESGETREGERRGALDIDRSISSNIKSNSSSKINGRQIRNGSRINSIAVADLPDIDSAGSAKASRLLLSNQKRSSREKVSDRTNNEIYASRSVYDTIWFTTSEKFNNPTDQVSSRHASRLYDRIVPLMMKRSRSLGLAVQSDSSWRVDLRYLSKFDSKNDLISEKAMLNNAAGLIHVIATIPKSDKKIQFLKQFKKTDMATARSILHALKIHVAHGFNTFERDGKWFVRSAARKNLFWQLHSGQNLFGKGGIRYTLAREAPSSLTSSSSLSRTFGLWTKHSPCRPMTPSNRGRNSDGGCRLFSSHVGVAPPVKRWSLLRVRLLGIPEKSQVFVAGYQANYEGGRIWSYWGQSGSQSNLTVLNDGRISFRKKIRNRRSRFAANQKRKNQVK